MYKIYFAGDLFDHKHLTGNAVLSKAIEQLSRGRYNCVLPQDWEGCGALSAIDIRNRDIKSVMEADLVLFNFDGTDLDSGTVVEFMIAKMLDIPAVLLRTDCRNGGYLHGDDWNLMVSGYPRCITVKYSALLMYNATNLSEMHTTIAQSIIEAFEKILHQNSLLLHHQEIIAAHNHVIRMCGGQLDKLVPPTHVLKIIQEKLEKNIYTTVVPVEEPNSKTLKFWSIKNE